ncbi:MAG: cytochrome c maturation protein CcmE [Proteobacteria bacterium]|nr:cytochrome c maturation protein CcmE [Pseudomonadota bacterium]
MKPRRQRLLAVGLTIAGIGIATALTLQAFKENMMFFVSITEVENGNYPEDRNFRVGGLVVEGSVRRKPGDLEVTFELTDLVNTLTITHDGILPDLFREGQGIIAHGRLDDQGIFIADEVLAKHDENYMPPEVAESLAEHAAAQEAVLSAEKESQ